MTYKIHINDLKNDKIVEREMTEDEIKQREEEIVNYATKKAEQKEQEEIAKTKRQLLLDKLGITEEEAELLLS